MPNFSSSDILVAEANVLYAPTGTSLPDETTVAYNSYDSWTDWVHLGYTDDVSNLAYAFEEFSYTPEQALSPLIRRRISESMTLRFALSQLTGAHLALLTEGTASDTSAGASQKAFTQVTGGGDTAISEYMFALEGYRPDSAGTKQPVRFFFHRCTINLNGDIPFGKQTAAILPVEVMGLTDTGKSVGAQLYEMHVVTAPASS